MNPKNPQVAGELRERATKARDDMANWRREMPAVWYGNRKMEAAIQAIDDLLAAAHAIAPGGDALPDAFHEVAAMDAICDAYNNWPADIRKKLSLHDLRRMSGWTPPLPAPANAVTVDDAWRLNYIERERLNVSPLEGGGWDVTAFDCGDSHETLLASRATLRSAIDETAALAPAAASGGDDLTIYEGSGCVFCDLNSEHRAPCTAKPADPPAAGDAIFTAEEVDEAMEVLRGRHGSTALLDEVMDDMERASLLAAQEAAK